MFRAQLFKRAFWTLFILAFLEVLTSKLYLQWTIWWVDIVLHFVGGLAVSLFALWIFSSDSDLKNWSQQKILLTALVSAITIGLAWEFYELYFGLTFLADGMRYFISTSYDLIMDLVGGIFGFIYTNNLLNKYE